MLKQILESQNNTAKNIGDELKILHTKIDGNYNDLNNKVKAQAKLKVAVEILKRDEHKAEKQVEREAVQKLKEVKLEGTTEVE
ncbi:hypothetical protein DY000_02018202 [Brassica cretica]|uniref:Uncharacterized protein n=1 Tax=Brassica cretica TaxID=69181 RepID=A0ABQ7CRF0_BRACR|nr:hypothetical protein DY000_02018202 [Brassica cretica]